MGLVSFIRCEEGDCRLRGGDGQTSIACPMADSRGVGGERPGSCKNVSARKNVGEIVCVGCGESG